MKKISFTLSRINNATCADGVKQSFLWDSDAKGLGLRITSNGVKSFIFQGKLNGQSIRITIGSSDAWPIESEWRKNSEGQRAEVRRGAREEARRLQGIIDRGIDPRQHAAEKKATAEAAKTEKKRKDVTLGEAWSAYIEARQTKWSTGHYRDHVVLSSRGGEPKKRGKGVRSAGPISSLLDIRLYDVTGDVLATWLEKESLTRPTAAALSFRLLRAFIRWANDIPAYRGLIPSDMHKTRAVRDALPKSRTKDGDSLQREQLAAWFDAVRKIRNPVISTYLQALLLTGARREEMAALHWEDVDFQWRSMTIRDKIEGARVIPLTPYLSSLLLNLKRINETPPPQKIRGDHAALDQWKPSEWVFFSKASANGYIAEPRIAHNEALQIAGLPHVTLHGLRRSFGTLCEWVEVPTGISAQIMGHKPSALAEKHYRRRPLDLLRMWHDKIEAWILMQAGIDFVPAAQDLRPVVSAGQN